VALTSHAGPGPGSKVDKLAITHQIHVIYLHKNTNDYNDYIDVVYIQIVI
jgi:hypothetical protein